MRGRLVACLECGRETECQGPTPREFCSGGCRKSWNNRRMTRGAELLDLYMAHRFDRQHATLLGLFQAINRLASDYRYQDRAERAGRRSWRRPGDVLAERPHLKAALYRVRAGK